jgi:hypothetical protein
LQYTLLAVTARHMVTGCNRFLRPKPLKNLKALLQAPQSAGCLCFFFRMECDVSYPFVLLI